MGPHGEGCQGGPGQQELTMTHREDAMYRLRKVITEMQAGGEVQESQFEPASEKRVASWWMDLSKALDGFEREGKCGCSHS